jgi:hypothetical protein
LLAVVGALVEPLEVFLGGDDGPHVVPAGIELEPKPPVDLPQIPNRAGRALGTQRAEEQEVLIGLQDVQAAVRLPDVGGRSLSKHQSPSRVLGPRGDAAPEIPLVALPHCAAGQLFLRCTSRGSRLPGNKPEALALLSLSR